MVVSELLADAVPESALSELAALLDDPEPEPEPEEDEPADTFTSEIVPEAVAVITGFSNRAVSVSSVATSSS